MRIDTSKPSEPAAYAKSNRAARAYRRKISSTSSNSDLS
ncbi:MAG: hypothetical protein ACI909_000562 [Planctomycetota bacterium]|jgi:hypothetical protein